MSTPEQNDSLRVSVNEATATATSSVRHDAQNGNTKVFVFTPSKLQELGLVAKIQDGKTFLVPVKKENVAQTSRINLEVVTHAVADLAVASREPPRPQTDADDNKNAVGGRHTPNSTPSRRRILHGFAEHWVNTIDAKGFVNCPLRQCMYISLTYDDMCEHYSLCKGTPYSTENVCQMCGRCLRSKADLKTHVAKSHSGAETKPSAPLPPDAPVDSKPSSSEPLMVRKRGYNKVHHRAWTISLEDKGYVKCHFQNCIFMALDVNEMIEHFRYCKGATLDNLVVCPLCQGGVLNRERLKLHMKTSHPEVVVSSKKLLQPTYVDVNNMEDVDDNTITTKLSSKKETHLRIRQVPSKSYLSPKQRNTVNASVIKPKPSASETQTRLEPAPPIVTLTPIIKTMTATTNSYNSKELKQETPIPRQKLFERETLSICDNSDGYSETVVKKEMATLFYEEEDDSLPLLSGSQADFVPSVVQDEQSGLSFTISMPKFPKMYNRPLSDSVTKTKVPHEHVEGLATPLRNSVIKANPMIPVGSIPRTTSECVRSTDAAKRYVGKKCTADAQSELQQRLAQPSLLHLKRRAISDREPEQLSPSLKERHWKKPRFYQPARPCALFENLSQPSRPKVNVEERSEMIVPDIEVENIENVNANTYSESTHSRNQVGQTVATLPAEPNLEPQTSEPRRTTRPSRMPREQFVTSTTSLETGDFMITPDGPESSVPVTNNVTIVYVDKSNNHDKVYVFPLDENAAQDEETILQTEALSWLENYSQPQVETQTLVKEGNSPQALKTEEWAKPMGEVFQSTALHTSHVTDTVQGSVITSGADYYRKSAKTSPKKILPVNEGISQSDGQLPIKGNKSYSVKDKLGISKTDAPVQPANISLPVIDRPANELLQTEVPARQAYVSPSIRDAQESFRLEVAARLADISPSVGDAHETLGFEVPVSLADISPSIRDAHESFRLEVAARLADISPSIGDAHETFQLEVPTSLADISPSVGDVHESFRIEVPAHQTDISPSVGHVHESLGLEAPAHLADIFLSNGDAHESLGLEERQFESSVATPDKVQKCFLLFASPLSPAHERGGTTLQSGEEITLGECQLTQDVGSTKVKEDNHAFRTVMYKKQLRPSCQEAVVISEVLGGSKHVSQCNETALQICKNENTSANVEIRLSKREIRENECRPTFGFEDIHVKPLLEVRSSAVPDSDQAKEFSTREVSRAESPGDEKVAGAEESTLSRADKYLPCSSEDNVLFEADTSDNSLQIDEGMSDLHQLDEDLPLEGGIEETNPRSVDYIGQVIDTDSDDSLQIDEGMSDVPQLDEDLPLEGGNEETNLRSVDYIGQVINTDSNNSLQIDEGMSDVPQLDEDLPLEGGIEETNPRSVDYIGQVIDTDSNNYLQIDDGMCAIPQIEEDLPLEGENKGTNPPSSVDIGQIINTDADNSLTCVENVSLKMMDSGPPVEDAGDALSQVKEIPHSHDVPLRVEYRSNGYDHNSYIRENVQYKREFSQLGQRIIPVKSDTQIEGDVLSEMRIVKINYPSIQGSFQSLQKTLDDDLVPPETSSEQPKTAAVDYFDPQTTFDVCSEELISDLSFESKPKSKPRGRPPKSALVRVKGGVSSSHLKEVTQEHSPVVTEPNDKARVNTTIGKRGRRKGSEKTNKQYNSSHITVSPHMSDNVGVSSEQPTQSETTSKADPAITPDVPSGEVNDSRPKPRGRPPKARGGTTTPETLSGVPKQVLKVDAQTHKRGRVSRSNLSLEGLVSRVKSVADEQCEAQSSDVVSQSLSESSVVRKRGRPRAKVKRGRPRTKVKESELAHVQDGMLLDGTSDGQTESATLISEAVSQSLSESTVVRKRGRPRAKVKRGRPKAKVKESELAHVQDRMLLDCTSDSPTESATLICEAVSHSLSESTVVRKRGRPKAKVKESELAHVQDEMLLDCTSDIHTESATLICEAVSQSLSESTVVRKRGRPKAKVKESELAHVQDEMLLDCTSDIHTESATLICEAVSQSLSESTVVRKRGRPKAKVNESELAHVQDDTLLDCTSDIHTGSATLSSEAVSQSLSESTVVRKRGRPKAKVNESELAHMQDEMLLDCTSDIHTESATLNGSQSAVDSVGIELNPQNMFEEPRLKTCLVVARSRGRPSKAIRVRGRGRGSCTLPDVDARPDLDARPDVDARPDFDARPYVGSRLDVDARPNVDARADVGTRSDVDAIPDIGSRPDVGSKLGVDARPDVDARPEVDRRLDVGPRPSEPRVAAVTNTAADTDALGATHAIDSSVELETSGPSIVYEDGSENRPGQNSLPNVYVENSESTICNTRLEPNHLHTSLLESPQQNLLQDTQSSAQAPSSVAPSEISAHETRQNVLQDAPSSEKTLSGLASSEINVPHTLQNLLQDTESSEKTLLSLASSEISVPETRQNLLQDAQSSDQTPPRRVSSDTSVRKSGRHRKKVKYDEYWFSGNEVEKVDEDERAPMEGSPTDKSWSELDDRKRSYRKRSNRKSKCDVGSGDGEGEAAAEEATDGRPVDNKENKTPSDETASVAAETADHQDSEAEPASIAKPGRKKRPLSRKHKRRGAKTLKTVLPLFMDGESECLSLNTEVQCGKCAAEMTVKSFVCHNRSKHSGLGWIAGQPEVDLSDLAAVRCVLNRVYKAKERKNLVCETCGAVKKSITGFISHLESVCSKSEEEREAMRVTCELCGRVMMRSSLVVHMGTNHRGPEPVTKRSGEIELFPEDYEPKLKKRAAAEKAETRLLKFIDDDKASSFEDPAVEDLLTDSPTEAAKKLFTKTGGIPKVTNIIISRLKGIVNRDGFVTCRNPGCDFRASDPLAMGEHLPVCAFVPDIKYQCQLCSFQSVDEAGAIAHVTEHHMTTPETEQQLSSDCDYDYDFISSEDDLEDFDLHPKFKNKKRGMSYTLSLRKDKISNSIRFLASETTSSVTGDKPYLPAIRWTLKFEGENYSETLYPSLQTTVDDWSPLGSAEAAEYLPEATHSLPLANLLLENVNDYRLKGKVGWRSLQLFEADIIDDTPVFFAGGPVWATAWCPIPTRLLLTTDSAVGQFLAVSCHRHMDDVYKLEQTYVGKGLIQIWDFGHLDNLRSCAAAPSLALGVAHEYGTVWHMEWCPSGAYEQRATPHHPCRLQRLGLLAAACSDGAVHIFSIPLPSQLPPNTARFPVYRAECLVTLSAGLTGTDRWMCTRFSWFRGDGHRFIAGGFANGVVAIWNLETTSPLLRRTEGKRLTLFPHHTFQAHLGAVTAVALFPHFDCRYLMTGGADRATKFWDLRETSSPITWNHKGQVSDGVWLGHWLAGVSSYDDSYGLGHCNAMLQPIRNFGFSTYPILAQNSPVWALSGSDWGNAVAQGTAAGELTVIFPHQLFVSVDTEKGMKNKRMVISYVDLVDLDKTRKGSQEDRPRQKPRRADRAEASDTDECINDETLIDLTGALTDDGGTKIVSTALSGENVKSYLKKSLNYESDGDDEADEEDMFGDILEGGEDADKDILPQRYGQVADRFGLRLCNYQTENLRKLLPEARLCMRQSDRMRQSETEMFPVTCINRVSWNPNCRSYLWLASGYHCGLVRVPCIHGMHTLDVERTLLRAGAEFKRQA